MHKSITAVVFLSLALSGCFIARAQSDWQWQNPLTHHKNIVAVDFANEQQGVGVGDQGIVITTSNGGREWVLRTPYNGTDLNDVVMIDAFHVVAVGQDGLILFSSDGGVHWEESSADVSKHLIGVDFLTPETGVVVGDSGTVLQTKDGGEHWTSLEYGEDSNLYDVHMFDDRMFVICGDSSSRTTDGGITWTRLNFENTGEGQRFHFYDNNTGILAYSNYRTYDGGKTWIAGDFIAAVYFNDASRWTRLGSFGFYQSSDAGASWERSVPFIHGWNYSAAFMPDSLHALGFGPNGIIAYAPVDDWAWGYAAGGSIWNLKDMDFCDSSIGYTVGLSGTILRTSNRGERWEFQQAHQFDERGEARHFMGVACIDRDAAVVVGESGTILRTVDGGQNWRKMLAPVSTVNWQDVSFSDEGTGIAVGTGGAMIRTTDAGHTWSQITAETNHQLIRVCHLDSNTVFVLDANAILHISTDKGDSWSPKTIASPADHVNAMDFIDARLGFVVGNNGAIWKTEDGGDTWETQTSGSSADLAAVAFTDRWNGCIAGDGGTILRTTDGGETWSTEPKLFDWGLTVAYAFDDRKYSVAGQLGIVLHNSIGRVTSVNDQKSAPQNIVLHQNYPNPFNPTTTILYSLQKPQRVSLIVTDLYGREVRRVIDDDLKDAGSHQVQFDATGVPSGVYLYTLIAGGQRQMKKMVMVR